MMVSNRLSCALIGFLVLGACGGKSNKVDCLTDPVHCLGDAGGPKGQGSVGKSCNSSDDCTSALRLACVDKTCSFTSDLSADEPCNATLECGTGLYCAVEDGSHKCRKAGMGAEGARCESTAECQRDLVCGYDSGLARHCIKAGEGDIGTNCDGPSDCLAGLYCTPPAEGRERLCAALHPGDSLFVPWDGPGCPDDDAAATAYFRVPRKDGKDGDFFRLPFPNDARKHAGKLDLSGFPSPGDLLGTGIDFVDSYVKASEGGLDGYATNPVAYFRFSQGYAGVGPTTVLMFDIDPKSPDYGRALSRSWGSSKGSVSSYVCNNWLNVRTPSGGPLKPATTYAIVLTNGIHPEVGGTFKRAADFEAMLAAKAPGEAALADAYAAYAPLRAFLADAKNAAKIKAADVLNATVFTTANATAVVAATREVVRAAAAPVAKEITVCKAGVKSPCDDGGERVCGAANPDFVEIHGKITLPIFQAGKAPYESAGGGFVLASGKPKLQRSEDVCFGLSLPKTAAPAAGYPLAIYAHGTGGSFKTGLNDLGAVVAKAGGAVLTIDMPQHGSRRNGSTRDPGELFFNYANPDAARDNVTQGSSDLFALTYFASMLSAAEGSPYGQAVKFDASKFVWFGHSQGATHASLAAPFENGIQGLIVSGVGGDLSESLTSKRSPVDIASTLYMLLGDTAAAPEGDLCPPIIDPATGKPRISSTTGKVLKYQCIGSNHPVYAMVQGFFERVDPVNFIGLLHTPGMTQTGKHAFLIYGLDDAYSPSPTQKAFALAGDFAQVGPQLEAVGELKPVAAPLTGNVKIGMAMFTQGFRQYAPKAGEDGHFVYQTEAKADWQAFLSALLKGTAPAIGSN